MPLSRNYAFLLLVFFLSSNVIAQSNEDNVPTTRAGEIQAERMEKAQNVQAPEPSAIGKQAARVADVIRVVPIRVVSEGLGTGHGIGIGAVLVV